MSNINNKKNEPLPHGFKICPTCGAKSGFPRNKENINRGYAVLETCKTCKGKGIITHTRDELLSTLYAVDSQRIKPIEAAKKIETIYNKWINVKDKMPENNQLVIAYGKNNCGKPRRIRAKYIKAFTVEDYNFQGEADYSEKNDTYYWPEGWYEENECEDTHWFVDFPITRWHPLPELPEE